MHLKRVNFYDFQFFAARLRKRIFSTVSVLLKRIGTETMPKIRFHS